MSSSLMFIFRFIVKERFLFAVGLCLTAMGSTLAWLGPRIIAYIIDQGLVPGVQKIALMGVLFLGLSECSRLLTSYLAQITYATLGQNVIERVRREMVSHLLTLRIQYFDRVSSGSMMTRVVNDAN